MPLPPRNGAAVPKLWPIGQVRECGPHMAGSGFSRGAENLGFSVIYLFLNVGNSFQMFSIIMWPKKSMGRIPPTGHQCATPGTELLGPKALSDQWFHSTLYQPCQVGILMTF